MSEYQCYELAALDRPLTSKQMAELRAISTRAEITPTRFWNELPVGRSEGRPREARRAVLRRAHVLRELGDASADAASPLCARRGEGARGLLYAALARDDARNAMILNDVVRALEKGGRRSFSRSARIISSTSRADSRAWRGTSSCSREAWGRRRTARRARSSTPFRQTRNGSFSPLGGTSARDSTTRAWTRSSSRCPSRGRARWCSTRDVSIDRTRGSARSASSNYVDREVPMLLRMFEKRLRGYRAIGYARGEAPLGYAEPKDDLIVEYDGDVLRALDHESATDRDDEFAEWVP